MIQKDPGGTRWEDGRKKNHHRPSPREAQKPFFPPAPHPTNRFFASSNPVTQLSVTAVDF